MPCLALQLGQRALLVLGLHAREERLRLARRKFCLGHPAVDAALRVVQVLSGKCRVPAWSVMTRMPTAADDLVPERRNGVSSLEEPAPSTMEDPKPVEAAGHHHPFLPQPQCAAWAVG